MSNQTAIPFIQMRGGSSKGIYFHLADLPQDRPTRDNVLKWVMGAYGDPRQVDGLGGADPLTSKIAIVSVSQRDDSDIDYSFIQALVGEDGLDDTPNCGNILSGIGAFAVETGLIKPVGDQANIRVYMTNSGNRCLLQFPLKNGLPVYHGDAHIDGVMGTSAPVMCNYEDLQGSACGSLFPTGNHRDEFDGVQVTCIDNGMPVVCLRASDFDIIGNETPEQLNANETLKSRLESIRLQAGLAMGLGDVSGKAVPKMSLVSTPLAGGTVNTRTFIPKHCHKAIGVLGAVSVASAALYQDSAIHDLATLPDGLVKDITIEHPSGKFDVQLSLKTQDDKTRDDEMQIERAGLLRTTRMLARGEVYVPSSVWDGNGTAKKPRLAQR
ncbi:MAG: 4-oxalomesaconate tautomerase [Candidatus Puniceispirillaceae bacterium]